MAPKTATKTVLKQALALPEDARAEIVEELLASLPQATELTTAEEKGIREGIVSMKAGRGRELKEVRARVLSSLKR